MKKKLKKGFTLVELVIVIAVIAILSAVLIPTFGNVISDAKEKAAMSDAHTAITQYMTSAGEDDFKELPDGYIVVLKEAEDVSSTSYTSTKIAYVFSFLKSQEGTIEWKFKTAPSDSAGLILTIGTTEVTLDITKAVVLDDDGSSTTSKHGKTILVPVAA